jgi:hypothetical protein
MDDRQYLRISELLLYCYDGTATQQDFAELEALLDHNRPALSYCVTLARELNYFHCLAQVPLSQPESAKGPDTKFMSPMDPQQQLALLGDFAEYEKQAAAITITEPDDAIEFQPVKKIRFERPARTINKFSMAAAILSIAAMLLMVLYLHLVPPAPYEVAAVADAVNAEWSSGLPIAAGTRITSNSKPIRLTRGIVKLRTDDQVEVILEAPTEFYFSSYSEVTMNYGKLFARVSEQGYGFSVVTPNSKVVDLGTEFGVLSHINGNTEVHLYKGKANVFAGEKHKRKISQILSEGMAVKVDSQKADIQDIAVDEQALVREIDSSAKLVWRGQNALRLTDLLLGGNGFGTATRKSISYDPFTGAMVPDADAVVKYRQGPGTMVSIKENPFLDGIFVPGSEEGDIVISSAGHHFQACPTTSGLYYANMTCRKDWTFFEPLQRTFERSRKHFSDPAVLYLHSNIGLTVDLNAVRRVVPGLRVSSFSAFAGIVRMGSNKPDYSEVDVWVLVDGQIRASHKSLRADRGFDVRVDISDTDGFLSLVVTDGGTVYSQGSPANHFDTCGFVEPVFGLVLP